LLKNSCNCKSKSANFRTDNRVFSSSSLVKFLSDSIEALPESSEVHSIFQQYLDDICALEAEAVLMASTAPHKGQTKHELVSDYDIQSRPGMRVTNVSQKKRQEQDRANMTSEDKEYTKIVANLNEILVEIFKYHKNIKSLIIRNLAPQDSVPLYEVFYFNITKTHADVSTSSDNN
jgi:hypothetical protein